ncbi:MAG: hypothetical protein JXL84_18445 [Deltaproteobacteria bacterium]|nr:hypothetical protein [Deltaproteobacteria bacterium]
MRQVWIERPILGCCRPAVEACITTHILAFEGDSRVVWFDGNYTEYEADKKVRLGEAAAQPRRIKYPRLMRGAS